MATEQACHEQKPTCHNYRVMCRLPGKRRTRRIFHTRCFHRSLNTSSVWVELLEQNLVPADTEELLQLLRMNRIFKVKFFSRFSEDKPLIVLTSNGPPMIFTGLDSAAYGWPHDGKWPPEAEFLVVRAPRP